MGDFDCCKPTDPAVDVRERMARLLHARDGLAATDLIPHHYYAEVDALIAEGFGDVAAERARTDFAWATFDRCTAANAGMSRLIDRLHRERDQARVDLIRVRAELAAQSEAELSRFAGDVAEDRAWNDSDRGHDERGH